MPRWFLFSLSFLALAVFAKAQPAALSPELIQKISQSSPEEFLPLILVLSPQANLPDLSDRWEALPKEFRRKRIITELRDLAQLSQIGLLADLKALETVGKARRAGSLWIVNAVTAQIKSEQILALSKRHPEVVRIVWDTPHALEQSTAPVVDAVDETGWGLVDVGAPQVWGLGYRGQGVVIGLIDTGIDYNHPDLQDRIWVNPGEDLNHNGVVDPSDWNTVDDDSNGYVDDLRGWDFYHDLPEVMEEAGIYNGTQAAGIIAGNGSGLNVTGMAPLSKLMVLKCYNYIGNTALLEAQQYALAIGADLISGSLILKWNWTPQPDYALLRQAADVVLASGLIQSYSIGYDALYQNWCPLPFNIPAPALCPPPWLHPSQTQVGGLSSVISSGAYDSNHQRKDSSSIGPSAWNLQDILRLNPNYPWGSTWLAGYNDYPWMNGQSQGLIKPDISAPTDVLTTFPGGLYSLAGGTMPSAAHTAGTLALMLSAAPQATPALLARHLMTAAVDMGPPGKDNLWGAGRLNAYTAVTQMLVEINAVLTGFVYDSTTGNPLDSVNVELPDLQLWAMTDSMGFYFIGNISAGNHDVSFHRPGWDSLLVPDLLFSIGNPETLSVSLTAPALQFEPSQITVTLAPGNSQQVPVIVQNPGTSPLEVTFRRKGDWTFGSLYSTIQAQIITGDEKLFGVEVADSSIWVSGGNNNSEPNYVYRFRFDGLLLDTLTQPSSTSLWGWHDLAWDGQFLYGSGTQIIQSLDLEGNPGPTISGPLTVHAALAYDPATDHFFAGDNTAAIVEINRSGAVIRSWTHTLHIQGLAWHPSDEDGCPLYIFSQDGPALQRVSKLNLDTGAIQFVLDLPGSPGEQAGGATLSGDLDVNRWCFLGLVQAPVGGNDKVRIHSLDVYAPWLIVEPTAPQVIPPGGSLEGVALLNAAVVPSGSYTLNLAVEHNAPAPEAVIPVSLTVDANAVWPEASPLAPADWALYPARPNPFNAVTAISYELRAASRVSLRVYDLSGRLVATLVDGWKTAGSHEVIFDGEGLGSGMYFVRMQAGEFTQTRKLVLMK